MTEAAENVFSFTGKRNVFLVDGQGTTGKVLHKTLLSKNPAVADLKRFENEFSFSDLEPIEGLRKVIGVGDTPYSLKLEWIDGKPLDIWMDSSHTLLARLKIGILLTEILVRLHQKGIIFKNLSPENIIITPENSVVLIDLSLATTNVSRSKGAGVMMELGDLNFISPEQTGRISRLVDHRTDLYSLGAVLYYLFSGKVPFPGADLLEKVHAHIAVKPAMLFESINDFPTQLSHIVGHLLSKNPDERYQSAFGVEHDLRRCLKDLEDNASIASFELQTQDFHGKLVFSNKLFGRENEIGLLFRAFDECSKGEKSFVSISGYSGLGKTAIVNELYEPVFRSRGFMLTGKFDKYQRDIPYFGFKQALIEFIQTINALDAAEVEVWKSNIYSATYPIGNVLSGLLPELSFLIGDQPELPVLNGPEAQNRFNYVLLSFIKAIASPGSPLVIFLDDIQWADSSSLQLIKVLLNDTDLKNILIIGAHRENEVNEGHVVQFLLNDLQKQGVRQFDILLQNLEQAAVRNMLAEVLQSNHLDLSELAEIVFKKSQGNALFIRQFLKSSFEDGYLKFDLPQRKWVWDKDRILRQNLTGEVEQLFLESVKKLPEDTKNLLTAASCIGNAFSPSLAAKISGIDLSQFKKQIQPALASGLVLEDGLNLIFAHDKIQQVLYENLQPLQQSTIHYKIAEILGEDHANRHNVFDLVNHYNLCLDLIEGEENKIRIATLNYQAGYKARGSVAFKEAFQYFETAYQVLPQGHWESAYQLSLDICTYAAETAYLNGKHDVSDQYVNRVISNAKTVEDRSAAIVYRMRAYTAENKPIEAIEAGYQLLRDLGVQLPKNPGKLSVLFGLIRISILLKTKSTEDILKLPKLENKRVEIIMDVIFAMLAPAYFAMPDFLPVGIFKMMKLTLKHGLGSKSAYGFLGFGYILSAFLGNIKAGTKYSNIGFLLHKQIDTKALASTVYGIYYALTNHWTTYLPDSISELKEGFRMGLETGDIEYTSYLAHNIIYHSFYSGSELKETLGEGVILLHKVESFNLEVIQDRINIFLQSIYDLIHEPEEPGVLEGEHYSERNNKYKPEKQNHILYHNLYFQKAFVALIYGKFDNAWGCIKETEVYLESVKGSALFPLFYFYRSLIVSTVFEKYPEKQAEFRKILKKDISKIKQYMLHSPKNYEHKYWLIMAEFARISKDTEKAQNYYFKALRKARQNRLIQDEALVWERAAFFYFEQGQDQVAEFYINNAYLSYKHWGAIGKTEQLVKTYPHLASNEQVAKSGNADYDLDLATVVKAYNAITGEIKMSKLLEKLMQIMIENAGAERGVLIRDLNGVKTIIAALDKEDGKVEVMMDEPLNHSQRLSQTVLNYASNSDSYVVLENAMNTRPYNMDLYIRDHEVKSVICMPVVQKGKHFGFLYLENNLVTGAFTQSRISLLKILSAQAAVSLENAELYEEMSDLNELLKAEIYEKEEAQKALLENEKRLEDYNANLERKVDERTHEISEQKDLIEKEKLKSDALLLNILPEETAEELKKTGTSAPRRYKEVTVMFTDFVNFSKISENISPDVLVNEIHYFYSAFDEIITKHKLEKIKTIGDSYMCAGGIPVVLKDHAARTVEAALEILAFIKHEIEDRRNKGGVYFDIRIGIHTGPVVAGIVGTRKFAYDIWGDTVNYASRMESSGEAGKLNISGSTYELVKDKYNCSYRGKIAAKSKGEIDMYFVE